MNRLAALALLALVGCGSAEAGGARQGDEPAPVADVLEPMPDAGTTFPVDAPDASPAPDAAAEAVDAAPPVPDAASPVGDASPPVDASAPVVDAAPVLDAAPPVDAAPATVNVCVLDTPYLLPDTLPATTLRQLNCGGSPLYLTDLNRTDGTATFRFDYRTAAQQAAGTYGGSTHCDVGTCVPGDRCGYLSADHPGTCKAVAR